MQRKGLELPINIIIVIAVAVLVLVVVTAFFIGNFGSNVNTLDLEQMRVTGCTNLRALYSCNAAQVNEVMVPKAGTRDRCSLGYICRQKGLSDANRCAQSCGCLPDESGSTLPTLDSACR